MAECLLLLATFIAPVAEIGGHGRVPEWVVSILEVVLHVGCALSANMPREKRVISEQLSGCKRLVLMALCRMQGHPAFYSPTPELNKLQKVQAKLNNLRQRNRSEKGENDASGDLSGVLSGVSEADTSPRSPSRSGASLVSKVCDALFILIGCSTRTCCLTLPGR